MAPKRATRSSARAGKDEEPKKQLSMEDAVKQPGDNSENARAGEKREAPVDLTEDGSDEKNKKEDKHDDSNDDKEKEKEPSSKKQRVDPPRKAYDEAKAEADSGKVLKDPNKTVDEQSTEAKEKGQELHDTVNTVKPSRGTLESGHIYFLYKPKVEVEDPEGIDDVSKFHTLLLPDPSGSSQTKYRFITAGRKHLPASRDDGGHETEWGMIIGIGENLEELKDTLGPSTYETKTRGTRHQPASRVAAHGHYILHSPEEGKGIKPLERADESRPQDFPIYLAYSIAEPLPEEFGDVQKQLDIKPQGSFAISVKNPDAPSSNPRAVGVPKERQLDYPDELRGLFTTRWIPANPVALLDYPGQELLLISGHEHLPDGGENEAQKKADKEIEEVKDLEKKGENEEDVIFKEVFDQLEMYKGKKDVPGIMALEGQWA